MHKKFPAVEREKSIPVIYTDTENIEQSVGTLRIDIFVHDKNNSKVYLLEIKAIKNMGESEVCQVNRYLDQLMKNYGMVVDEAYIINFPPPSSTSIPDDIIINKVV